MIVAWATKNDKCLSNPPKLLQRQRVYRPTSADKGDTEHEKPYESDDYELRSFAIAWGGWNI